MNFIKNKIKIFIRNLKHLQQLMNTSEIPKKSIYNCNIKIHNFNFEKNNFANNRPVLLLSSKYDKVISSRFTEFNRMFKYLKDFDIFFFNHTNRNKYMKKYWKHHDIYKLYKSATFHQMKSDIFRYCFIFDNGGYWLDFKSSVYFNFSNLMQKGNQNLLTYGPSAKINEKYKFLKDSSLLSSTEGNIINNWVFGADKHSKFFNFVIENISKDYLTYKSKVFDHPKEAILELTGPYKITKLFYKYINEDNDRIKEFFITSETDYEFQYISDFGRDFKLSDNIFFKHYSNVVNKKIIR